MDFNSEFKRLTNIFETHFKKFLSGLEDIPEPLISAMKYSAESGGKRLRPVLLLGANELFCGNDYDAVNFAIAIELIHTYSLIHDDLPCMDNDDLRRGKPTNHNVFGEGQAVLAGDALLNLAYELILETALRSNNCERCLKAAKYISNAVGAKGMIAGQCLDIKYESVPEITLEQLEVLHQNKTGKLINASFLAGGLLNGVSDDALEHMLGYSNNLGVAFQIVDDILDVIGETGEIGKKVGSDIIKNKHTYAKLYDIQSCKEIAEEYINSSIESINKLQFNTDFFQQLALFVLNRRK